MDRFEAKLLKLIFKAGTSNLVKLDLSKLKYDDRLLINDFIEYGALSLNKKKELIITFITCATNQADRHTIKILIFCPP